MFIGSSVSIFFSSCFILISYLYRLYPLFYRWFCCKYRCFTLYKQYIGDKDNANSGLIFR
nr:MAG TPA: hypothetical protein [Caudoviricetes sp.]